MSELNNLRRWIVDRNQDYGSVRSRLEYCRNILLYGRIDSAADMLRKSYLNAVMSIQTDKDRHERAFTAYHTGSMDLKEAFLETVYGGQKHGWVIETLSDIDFKTVIRAIRAHHRNGSYTDMLQAIVDNFKGLSHRKASFTLAMIGMHEFMCIDSNVGRFASIDANRSYNNAHEYMNDCEQIYKSVGNSYLPPFIVQWAIYDYERGEHARHMAFYREVLNL